MYVNSAEFYDELYHFKDYKVEAGKLTQIVQALHPTARTLLDVAAPAPEPEAASDPATPDQPCPCCGSAMRVIEVFAAGDLPRHRPAAMPAAIRIDTS